MTMTTPAAINDVVGPLQALLEKATLPWAYRPEEYDDWGFIRGPEVPTSYGTGRPVVAISRGSDTDHDKHRRNGTDPYKAHGDLIVAAVNALPSLLGALSAATARADAAEREVERVREAMERDFRQRAHLCRTNLDGYDATAASVWDLAADAVKEK